MTSGHRRMTAGLAAIVSLMPLTGCQTTDYVYAGRRSVPWAPRAPERHVDFEDVCCFVAEVVVEVAVEVLIELAESAARCALK